MTHSPPNPLNARSRRRAAAFTLIEVLVVIGILLILIALAVVGFKAVSGAAKTRVTTQALETSKSLLNDFELTSQITQLLPVPPVATGHWAASVTPLPGITPATYNDNALYCTTAAAADTTLLRQDTARVLMRLRSVPKNRDTIDKLPPERVLQVPAFGTLSVSYRDSTGTATNGVLPASNTAVPTLTLVDAYGNPVYFVPGGGLTGVNVAYRGSGDKTVATNYDQSNSTIFAPDRRPFWVSAGPDGDLTTGDDNQYSFGD